MNTTPFAKDDTAYLEDGDEVIYVAQADRQHVVIPIFQRERGEPSYGSPMLVSSVYREPPVEKRFAKIAELDEQIRQAQAKLREINAEVLGQERARAAILARLKQNSALKRIDDFLAGSITHFVLHCESYVEVMPTARALNNGNGDNRDTYDRTMKLVTLFGDTKGDLEWRINEYRDGCGSWKSAVPFTSEEEATAFAVELMSKKLADPKTTLYYARRLIPYARILGVSIPEHVTAAINAEDEAESTKKMANLEVEIARLQKQIDDKRAAATASAPQPLQA